MISHDFSWFLMISHDFSWCKPVADVPCVVQPPFLSRWKPCNASPFLLHSHGYQSDGKNNSVENLCAESPFFGTGLSRETCCPWSLPQLEYSLLPLSGALLKPRLSKSMTSDVGRRPHAGLRFHISTDSSNGSRWCQLKQPVLQYFQCFRRSAFSVTLLRVPLQPGHGEWLGSQQVQR